MNPIAAQFVFNSAESPNNFIFNAVGRVDPVSAPAFAGSFVFFDLVTGVASDLYCVGACSYNTAGQEAGIIYKLTTKGEILWQRTINTTTAETCNFNSCVVDSADDVYAVGLYTFTNASGNYGEAGIIAKYNSSGVLQFQRSFYDATFTIGQSATTRLLVCDIDSSNNIYVAGGGFVANSSEQKAVIAKYNTAGTIQWQRGLTGPGPAGGRATSIYDMSVDTAGNICVGGEYFDQTAAEYRGLITKYNTSGTILLQRAVYNSVNPSTQISTITTDAQQNIIAGTLEGNSTAVCIVKLNSSGTLLWQRKLTAPATSTGGATDPILSWGSLTVVPEDGSIIGNCIISYITFTDYADGIYQAIFKYSSGGVLEYQRRIQIVSSSGLYPTVNSMELDSSKNMMYSTASVTYDVFSSPYTAMVNGFRSNGGNLGTFPFLNSTTSLIYSTGNLTDAAGGNTVGAVTVTGSTTTYTTGTTTFGTGFASGINQIVVI